MKHHIAVLRACLVRRKTLVARAFDNTNPPQLIVYQRKRVSDKTNDVSILRGQFTEIKGRQQHCGTSHSSPLWGNSSNDYWLVSSSGYRVGHCQADRISEAFK